MYANYLAGLARSSDKMVTNLLSLVEGFTVQQLPPAVHSDSMFVGFLLDLYVIYTIKWPLLNAIRNPNLVLI